MESDSLLERVDLLSFSLVHRDLSLLVSGNVSSRLDDTPVLEGTDGDGGEERSEEEVVSRRDNDDVEFIRVEVFQERGCTPT